MKYPIGIQSFEKIRREGYVYVDKTALMYKMVAEGSYYFLSRPRRFGKSLMVSTLEAFFSGERELFKGLYVDSVEWNWQQYPILHLDLNVKKYDTKEDLQKILKRHLEQWERKYDSPYSSQDVEERFLHVVECAHEKTGKQVVILVDEYDKPLLQAIGNEELQAEYRNTLKAFYGVLKSCDRHIKFAFLTGVTKFGKVSVFSDLNNLIDISMLPQYSNICGITETELHDNFDDSVEALAEANGMNKDECYKRLQQDFDGYHFNEFSKEGIYNPFSVLNTFAYKVFRYYWFETGTPSYLVELLRRYDYNLDRMSHADVTGDVLNSIDADSKDPIPVIYQSGYLTIKGYDPEFKEYRLGFPNKEVEEGFVKYLVPFYLSNTQSKSAFDVRLFVDDVRNGRPEQFCLRLKSLFADTPYELVKSLENHYQNIVWVVFKMLGFYSQAEYHTSEGRIDLVIVTPLYRYVMEFKLDGTVQEALEQIKSKNYALPFALDSRQTFLIGMNFSNETWNIEQYIIKKL